MLCFFDILLGKWKCTKQKAQLRSLEDGIIALRVYVCSLVTTEAALAAVVYKQTSKRENLVFFLEIFCFRFTAKSSEDAPSETFYHHYLPIVC